MTGEAKLVSEPISKLEGARRQLDTAIDLYFDGADSLATHTLAWASFKVLFDLYPHHNQDGFSNQLDELLGQAGWRKFASVANFLKHANRDPDAFLASHHAAEVFGIIGLSTVLYQRIAGDLSLKMRGFETWVEWLGAEELEIEEPDRNAERVAREAELRRRVNALPHDERVKIGRRKYRFHLENYHRIKAEYDEMVADGKTIQQILDEVYERAEKGKDANAQQA